MRSIPNWIDAYLEYTSNTEPKESYRTWAGLSTIASALQRKCSMQIGSELFFPNLYVVLVGPPAARKGTAIRPATELMRSVGINLAADESSRQKLVTSLFDSGGMHTDGNGKTYIHSSLSVVASELTVFLGYQNVDFLTVLCKWYDCEDRFVYDTHKHGKQEVSNVWVNLLGATTPMLIQASLPITAIGSGFASRTVFVYEERKASWIAHPTLKAELSELLRRDLGELKNLCGSFKCDDTFYAAYNPWYEAGGHWTGFAEPRLEFYAQRRHVQLLKLSMLYSAARSNEMIVTKEDFDRALTTLTSTERTMGNTFRGFGTNPVAATQLRVIKILAENKKVRMKDLMAAVCEDIDSKGLGAILATLEEMGVCKTDLLEKIVYYTKKED